VEIRKLTLKNYDELIKLWSKAKLSYRPRVRDSRNAIVAQMKANPDYFLGAFENNRLVGTVVISNDLRKGWINRLAVDPECRRHGIAAELIAQAEKALRRHGIKIFAAQIEDDNTASKQLFKKCGYVEHRDVIYFSKRDSDDV